MKTVQKIKAAITSAVLKCLPGVRSHHIPAASDVDAIVAPLSEIMFSLYDAATQHQKRAVAQSEAAERLRKDALQSDAESARALRRANKLAEIVA